MIVDYEKKEVRFENCITNFQQFVKEQKTLFLILLMIIVVSLSLILVYEKESLFSWLIIVPILTLLWVGMVSVPFILHYLLRISLFESLYLSRRRRKYKRRTILEGCFKIISTNVDSDLIDIEYQGDCSEDVRLTKLFKTGMKRFRYQWFILIEFSKPSTGKVLIYEY